MFNSINAKLRKVLSHSQIFFNHLLSRAKETGSFATFIITRPFGFVYNIFQALYSFIYVAYNAESYATSKVFAALLSHKKNAYQLARALCQYRENFCEYQDPFEARSVLQFIITPQNTKPYESVELASYFLNNVFGARQLNWKSREKLFEFACKACCWGVAEPYRKAIELLLTSGCYTDERGLYLLCLNSHEIFPHAQNIIAGQGPRKWDYKNIGSTLPAEQTPHHFKRLLARIEVEVSSESFKVLMNKILHFFHTHPQHLHWANDIASNALEGCVNQPLMGWLEICAWVHIAKQQTIIEKLRAATFLQALAHTKLIISNSDDVSSSYHPEYVCGMMQTVYYNLCAENVLHQPWIGICDQLWRGYRHFIENDAQLSFQREKILHSVKTMTIDDAIETVFMQSAGRGFWAQIAVNQEVAATFSAESDKEIEYLRKVILYLAGEQLADILEEIREIGYQSEEFEVFLEQKSPGHTNKSAAEKIAEIDELNKQLQVSIQHDEISLNQKALIWTKRQVAQELTNSVSSSPRPKI